MTKKDKPKAVDPEQVFLHEGFALMHLKDAWFSLEAIEKLCGKCAAQTTVVPALIRDAVIQYGSAFKPSNVGEGQTRKLDSSIVPDQYRELHEQIITYRDKVFAHIDIEPRNPQRKTQGEQVCYSVADMRPQDFLDRIADMKSLIYHMMNVLGLDVLKQAQEWFAKDADRTENH